MKKAVSANAYGSAAVDLYAPARRQAAPAQLPEERRQPEPVRKVRVRAKMAVAPFTIVGFALAAVMLILVVFGYVQLYEATSENAALASQASDLRETNAKLVSQYEGQVDLAHVEDAAIHELGMQKVMAEQSVYVDLSSASDRGVVIAAAQHKSALRRAIEALRDSVQGLLEYLS